MGILSLKTIHGEMKLVDTNLVTSYSIDKRGLGVMTIDGSIFHLEPSEFDKLHDAMNAPR